MRREYEVVEHLGFEGLHVLLVSMDTRLPHLHRELELGWILQGSVELHTRLGSRLLQRGDRARMLQSFRRQDYEAAIEEKLRDAGR